MCDWVLFSVGGVWGGRSCVPCCVWRARGGVHAVMIAQCAVVAAVRNVVRACGTCVSVCCVSVRAVRGLLVCAVLCDTRHDADVPVCGACSIVCVCVRAFVVWCRGARRWSACARRCALGLRICEESWLRHTRDVRCAHCRRSLERSE